MANVFRCPACNNVIADDADDSADARCPICDEKILMRPSADDVFPLRPPPSSSGMAIGSLVCSILALLTCLVPLGIVGMILGIKALNLARVHPRRYDGASLARAGFIIGGLSVVTGLIAIPSTWHWFNNRQKEMSRRTACMANCRGLGSVFYIYAIDPPHHTFPMTGDVRRQNDGAFAAFDPQTRTNPPGPGDPPSPTVDLWMIARSNDTTPRQFVCPSTKDVDDPAWDTTLYYDFLAPNNLSYSYLYQHDPDRKPIGISSEPQFPVLADANPYIKGGVTSDFAAYRTSRSRGNSFNHGRDGQNVLYQDGHVWFEKTPDVGLMSTPAGPPTNARTGGDNIYTTHKPGGSLDPGDAAPTLVGTRGTCNLGSKSDACLIP